MTRNEAIEILAREYRLELPLKDKRGKYIFTFADSISGWDDGCYNNGKWLSIEQILHVLNKNGCFE